MREGWDDSTFLASQHERTNVTDIEWDGFGSDCGVCCNISSGSGKEVVR
jgi:hypothetical protein